MRNPAHPLKNCLADLAIAILVFGALLYGFSLSRYPGYYVDSAFFAFPALRATLGHPFAYVVDTSAPYANQIWAYHGPLLPHLYLWLFKFFGFSILLTRLPDFLGGWLAVLTLVIFLKQKGYRYAGLILAILWCGDRAPQEIMYGRMDGLALFILVLAFLALERAYTTRSAHAAFWCGVLCGLAALANPFCLFFALPVLIPIAGRARWKAAVWFIFGASLNLLLLLDMWRFQVSESIAQFLWHMRVIEGESASHSIRVLIHALKWSKYWYIALIAFTVACIVFAIVRLIRNGWPSTRFDTLFLLAAAFALPATASMFRSSTHPYYIVYLSLWPMLCLAIAAEEHWPKVRYVALVMGLVWLSSAAWNLERIRESILFHAQLSPEPLYAELRKDVPPNAQIDTIPVLYSVPIVAGFRHYNLTRWFPQHQDVCPVCYLLITSSEFADPQYIAQANLQQRRILYAGPAFPGAGPMSYPVVLLSPEQSGNPRPLPCVAP